MENIVRLCGVVCDFNGIPLKNADVALQDENFECIYSTRTNEDGYYELNVEEGLYHSLFVCKEYKIKYLEYWAWNIPLYRDMTINAKIDGLEVYAINVFKIQSTLLIYFRPISLQRYKEMEVKGVQVLDEKSQIINICPDLAKTDLVVSLNDEELDIVEINKVIKYAGQQGDITQHIYGYLIQVDLLNTELQDEYNKINIEVFDSKTKEKGEGTIYWKQEKRYKCIN